MRLETEIWDPQTRQWERPTPEQAQLLPREERLLWWATEVQTAHETAHGGANAS